MRPLYQRIPEDPDIYRHRLQALQAIVDRVDEHQGQPRRIVRGEPGRIAEIDEQGSK